MSHGSHQRGAVTVCHCPKSGATRWYVDTVPLRSSPIGDATARATSCRLLPRMRSSCGFVPVRRLWAAAQLRQLVCGVYSRTAAYRRSGVAHGTVRNGTAAVPLIVQQVRTNRNKSESNACRCTAARWLQVCAVSSSTRPYARGAFGRGLTHAARYARVGCSLPHTGVRAASLNGEESTEDTMCTRGAL